MSQKSQIYLIDDMLMFLEDIEKYLHDIGYDESIFFEWGVHYDAIILKLALLWEWWIKLQEISHGHIADFPFSEMRWLRNRIIHDYLGVNDEMIWDALIQRRKELSNQLEIIKKSLTL